MSARCDIAGDTKPSSNRETDAALQSVHEFGRYLGMDPIVDEVRFLGARTGVCPGTEA